MNHRRPAALLFLIALACTPSASRLREAAPDISGNTLELTQRYAAIRLTADKELKGKVIRVRSEVASVGTGFIENGVEKPGVFVNDGWKGEVGDAGHNGVDCYLHPDALADGNGLSQYQKVTVQGVFYKFMPESERIKLSPCVVVERQ